MNWRLYWYVWLILTLMRTILNNSIYFSRWKIQFLRVTIIKIIYFRNWKKLSIVRCCCCCFSFYLWMYDKFWNILSLSWNRIFSWRKLFWLNLRIWSAVKHLFIHAWYYTPIFSPNSYMPAWRLLWIYFGTYVYDQ